MADNLPLIPSKDGVACTDVRPVIREVFRELDCLPPRTEREVVEGKKSKSTDGTLPQHKECVDSYDAEKEELWHQEEEMKQEYAIKVARPPLPNIHKLHSREPSEVIEKWKLEKNILRRADLKPRIEQNAGRDTSLWIKNILNKSSSCISAIEVQGHKIQRIPQLYELEVSDISVSIGNERERVPSSTQCSAPAPASSAPDYLICVPPQLKFINFTLGRTYYQSFRLVNVSKYEVRLSIRPPKRNELEVEICSSRGLIVTAGAAAKFKLKFTPHDVRAVKDQILVRCNKGNPIVIPISCFMEPPLLNIVVPHACPYRLYCREDPSGSWPPASGDVLELGAKLLGQVHSVEVLLHSTQRHAEFFLITEEAWLNFSLLELSEAGSLVCAPFVVRPAWWGGGGAVRGSAWCRAPRAGLHATSLRLVASTAVARPLHVLADSLHFHPEHISIKAHDKDYDICSDDDPACKYYVNLGTAFPNRALSSTIEIVNHSPLIYNYYWTTRPWGLCWCWQEEKTLEDVDSSKFCIGAIEAAALEPLGPQSNCYMEDQAASPTLRVQPSAGSAAPRSACSLHVCVEAGTRLGTHKAVLMLILRDIPEESFTPGYEPMIVETKIVDSEPIPGVQGWKSKACSVVVAQMEVWWDVVPARGVVHPQVLHLPHSRRIKEVTINIQATQLFGYDNIFGKWVLPNGAILKEIGKHMPESTSQRLNYERNPNSVKLTPSHSCDFEVNLPLPSLPTKCPENKIISLVGDNEEWTSQCSVRHCSTPRYPSLSPARAWLGLVAPGTSLNTNFFVHNDTHQYLSWRVTWYGGNSAHAWCGTPCARCSRVQCTCSILTPARGTLAAGLTQKLQFEGVAPNFDCCVATLVQLRGIGGENSGAAGRGALLAYQVVVPALYLRLLPLLGSTPGDCQGWPLDRPQGAAVLRPAEPLSCGHRVCYVARLTNTTPLSTSVKWEHIVGGENTLKVYFFPNEFSIEGYGVKEIQVVLEARRVCRRRLFMRRAHVQHANRPLYLLIDTAIAGLEVICELPLGGKEHSESFAEMRIAQKETSAVGHDGPKFTNSGELFAEYDEKRKIQQENVCWCKYQMKYIPPKKVPQPPLNPEDYTPIEIVTEPPSLTRVCGCSEQTRPLLPLEREPLCLQFINVPLRTVRSRKVVLRNVSSRATRWAAYTRRWTRQPSMALSKDPWSTDVRDPGVVFECVPPRGLLAGNTHTALRVHVYADSWGVYTNQLLIQIENLEPIIVEMWVEVVGPPLQFALKHTEHHKDSPPVLWMTPSDPERTVYLKNTSRCDLVVHVYVLQENERPQDDLPFRLYLRLYDVPSTTCPCVRMYDQDNFGGEEAVSEVSSSMSCASDVDTAVEIFMSADYGKQSEEYYQVKPQILSVERGGRAALRLRALGSAGAPPCALLLRARPVQTQGQHWCRPEPPAMRVALRSAPRRTELQLSIQEVRVCLNALDLPAGDVMRLRKRFRVKNCGGGVLEASYRVDPPWNVVTGSMHASCGSGCLGAALGSGEVRRAGYAGLRLAARQSTEMCVEVSVLTADAWNDKKAIETGRATTTTTLFFYEKDDVLKTLPLLLDIEYPKITANPPVVDFGYVCEGDTRKTYFTVSHTSQSPLMVEVHWRGAADVRVQPTQVWLSRGGSARVYLQYTAKWRPYPIEGFVCVSVASGKDISQNLLEKLDAREILRRDSSGLHQEQIAIKENEDSKLINTTSNKSLFAKKLEFMKVFGMSDGSIDTETAVRTETTPAAENAPRTDRKPAAETVAQTDTVPTAETAARTEEIGVAADSVVPLNCSTAAAWCLCMVAVRAAPSRDYKCHLPVHDYTDNADLLPDRVIVE